MGFLLHSPPFLSFSIFHHTHEVPPPQSARKQTYFLFFSALKNDFFFCPFLLSINPPLFRVVALFLSLSLSRTRTNKDYAVIVVIISSLIFQGQSWTVM